MTATASVNVLKDIKIEFSRQKQRLEDENIKSLLDYSREELQFEVINDKGNKNENLKKLINELKVEGSFTQTADKAGLVFTPNVNGAYGCYNISNTLNSIYPGKVGWFSGDIPKRDIYDEQTGRKTGSEPVMDRDEFNKYKQTIQREFKENKYSILVATKAFGMGIDKQNIFYTFHYGLPSSVEALYQEAGRAGRWDKRKDENKNKIGKCYVLHSPETHDQNRVDRLFHKDTTFAEMKAISDEVGFGGRDIFKQVFLFVKGQNDIEKDFEIILGVIDNYFQENRTVRIFWNDAFNKLHVSSDVLQKAIYRLSILGIVSDWTTNFVDHFEVQFLSLEKNHVHKSISEYIKKYEPSTEVLSQILKEQKGTDLKNAIWYLLKWTFENIAYSRKQSLKTLSDWCSEFNDSESFKRRIDSYFKFTETTFILQYITENPRDYPKWFEALYLVEQTNDYDEDGNRILTKVHIPEIDNETFRTEEFRKLKDSLSRFLIDNKNNDGLNFLSGFVRLALNEYSDSDGKERFESTLSNVQKYFHQVEKSTFLNELKELGTHLPEEQKMELSQSIVKYFPDMLEELADYYGLAYLLNDVYSEKVKQLKALNKKLYEQLTEV